MTKPTQPGHRRTTMKDVAMAANVSVTTVSFVLNNVEGVSISQETRDRVLDAMTALNYRPNAAAAALRTNRSHSIGFITDFIASGPFAGDTILGAQQEAWDAGQLLTIIHTGNDSVVTAAAIEMLIERRVDGIICATLAHRIYQPPEIVWEVPTVLLNCSAPDRSLPSVVPDEVQGGFLATQALLEAGHQRIGFVNFHNTEEFAEGHPPEVGRLTGYKHALSACNIEFEPDRVIAAGYDVSDGYNATNLLLQRDRATTAIFCGNDRMAMGAYYALAEAGLHIPNDVSVIGFDDQQLISSNLRPSLSTVALPFAELGRQAVTYLHTHSAVTDDPAQLQIPCRLIERHSIAAVPLSPPHTPGVSDPRKEANDG